AEIYDFQLQIFRLTSGDPLMPRTGAGVALLKNGKVLIAGGEIPSTVTATVELYDPATDSFSPTGSMIKPRFLPTATVLQDGKVLIAGGGGSGLNLISELYDPNTGQFQEAGPVAFFRQTHTATLLQSGDVLVA